MIVPLVRTGWMVIDADGAIIVTIGATASGTPMECPPPSTSETVGFFIPEMSSAMASPASTSPPTVLSRNKTPSMSSLSSKYASSGSTCSYFVAFWRIRQLHVPLDLSGDRQAYRWSPPLFSIDDRAQVDDLLQRLLLLVLLFHPATSCFFPSMPEI